MEKLQKWGNMNLKKIEWTFNIAFRFILIVFSFTQADMKIRFHSS
jgi:hypothetical protein